jgi:hypothetical protein
MSFPESLTHDFDILDSSPHGLILPGYRVKEKKLVGRKPRWKYAIS